MLQIKKLRDDIVIDFAAEELKKYLRMMMPGEKVVDISLDPQATEGFRLGLLADFSLPCESDNTDLDDIVHIDTDTNGGILAGSNPRSVLFAVYRYLKLNGCRFLFPGAEGEYIPKKAIEPQKYHKLADHRFRGHAIEGDPSLEQVLDYIDFHAKEELNCFGCYGIFNYMRRYYGHRMNEENRAPEFMDIEVAESQWRALFECEVLKRGLLLYRGEHTLLARAIGLKVEDRYLYKYEGKEVPKEVIPFLAKVNGVRELYRKDFFYTNLCMSNPEVRRRIVNTLVSDILARPQVDNAGLSLADLSHNHCECENCRTKRPSDWLVVTLNELDAELTRRGIDKVINFSFYVDIMFAPAVEKLNNPSRFRIVFCPISRTYNSSIKSLDNLPEPIAYKFNAWRVPKSMEELYALLKEWMKVFPGPYNVFDYHFWIHQYRDPGLMSMSRRLYEDVRSYRPTNMDGCMQDGSNKSFFPHGFHGHIYAAALLDRECDYEEELADYFSHLYGEDWKLAREYLDQITEAFDHRYMTGELSLDESKGLLYNPQRLEPLSRVRELTEKMRAVIADHMMMPTRPQSVAWRILLRHTEYCDGLAEVMMEKCQGHDAAADARAKQLWKDFGRHDYELERWFDFGLCANSITGLLKKHSSTIEQ